MHKRVLPVTVVFLALASFALAGCGGKDNSNVGPDGTPPKVAPPDLKPIGTTGSGGGGSTATKGKQAD